MKYFQKKIFMNFQLYKTILYCCYSTILWSLTMSNINMWKNNDFGNSNYSITHVIGNHLVETIMSHEKQRLAILPKCSRQKMFFLYIILYDAELKPEATQNKFLSHPQEGGKHHLIRVLNRNQKRAINMLRSFFYSFVISISRFWSHFFVLALLGIAVHYCTCQIARFSIASEAF